MPALRYLMGVLATIVALSAIGSGIIILAGIEQFPVEWLQGTPFSDYIIPALLLSIVVGGSSLIAALSVFTNRQASVLVSMAAGLIMAGWIIGEMILINAPRLSMIEGLHFTLGVLIFELATYLWLSD